MAIASTYNTGTASINAGETTVSGQGTTWLTSGIRAGDLFWAAGFSVRIAAVVSNTSLTLAYAWPGANRVAAAYEIRYTPDAERVLASTREMLTALGANAISPLVGLVPAANKGIFYTGAAAASLFDFTAFARSLLDDADAAAARATLGLNGDGIGNLLNGTAGAYIASGADFQALSDGFRGLVNANGASHAPPQTPGVNFFWCEQQKMYAGSAARLRATGYLSTGAHAPIIWEMIRANDGTWGPWARVFNSRNILGTVAQSGGVPTGAIFERGSNGNGDYVRFADGTQISWINKNTSISTTNAQTGGGYRSDGIAFPFPAAFSAPPTVTAMNFGVVSGAAGNAFAFQPPGQGTGTTSITLYLFSMSNTSVYGCALVAIGRWY